MTERFAGRYDLLRRLGRGGMGEVFLARDLATGASCALKRLVPGSGARLAEVRREFEILSRLKHPAVVAVHELAIAPDGTPFYTMEYVPGRAADRAVDRGDWQALFFIAAEVSHALEALHGLGVVHGDLKPGNLLVVPGAGLATRPSSVRLLDFGLARVLGDANGGHRGTPGYAAPEVVRGDAPQPPADLYGLGSTLYALVAGAPPFGGEADGAVLRRQREGPPSALTLEEAGSPSALSQLILRLMAPSPAERPRDAREVRRELESMHPAARRPLSERLHTVTLVGRAKELGALEGGLARGARRARVVVVRGATGIGKSELLGELATRAALGGRSVIHLACGALAGPGAGALALLRRLAVEARADIPGAGAIPDSPPAAGPGLAAGLSEANLGPLVDWAVSSQRAIEKRSGPPLILLDDSDYLDPLSRSFIRRLAMHPGGPATSWVLSRRGGTGNGDEDERVLVDAGAVQALDLEPLTRDDVERLAAARLHGPSPSSLSSFLWERGRGHPGLTVELMRLAAARGALEEGPTGVVAESEALEALGLPESFEASLAARVADLPAGARRAAAALAVLQAAAAPERLASIEPAATPSALEQLLGAGLVIRDAAGRLALASPTFGRRLCDSLTEDERRALHRAALCGPDLAAAERFRHLRGAGDLEGALAAAAGAFESHPDAEVAAAAAALAESRAPAEAALWHERAGDVLSARARYASAISHLGRALELDPAPGHAPRRLHRLSTAYLRAGMHVEASATIGRALAQELPPGWRSRLLSNQCARFQMLGEKEKAAEAGRDALAEGERAGDDEAVGTAAQALVYSLLDLGRLDEAEAMASRAAESYDRIGHALGRIRAVGARAAVARARQRLPEAEKLYRAALAQAREQDNRLAAEEILVNLSVVQSESGQWIQMRETNAEAARLALEDHRPRRAAVALANLAHTDALTGRPRAARRQARAAIRLAREHLPWLETSAWRSLAQGFRIGGRLRKAERAARHALDLALKSGLANEVDWCRIEYGSVLAATGRWQEAGALWSRAVEAPHPDATVGFIVLLTLSGRAALRRGDHAQAASRLALADSRLAGRVAPYAAALADQLRAELAISQGRRPEGLDLADRTLNALLALPAPADRALAALEFARLAVDAPGGPDQPVGEWLEQAAGAFERLGDRRGRERALALLVQWLNRTRGPAAPGERNVIEAVSRLLSSLSDLRELAQRAMAMVVEQLNAERGVLVLADPESGRLDAIAEYGAVDAGTRSEAVGFSRRVVERVAESGGSLLIDDAPSDPRSMSDSMVNLRLRSIVCVPMYLGGKVVGAVYLDDSRRARAFQDADRGLLEGFAHLMAVAIEKHRGQEEVRRANEQLVGENLSLRQEAAVRFQPHRLIGTSSQMQRVLAWVERAAQANSSVLLTGENGTGKELIARILHHGGKRRLRPFVAVNCGAIPEPLLETELFGILPNVATDVRGRDGRFKQADGGTLFLDEVGDMPLKQQVALLSAIANREITPVGGGKPIPVDVRIISATNRDLRRLIEQGAFREDLFYRLNVIPIEVPPLRERKADIPALAQHFVAHFARSLERDVPELSPDFMAALMRSDWPGNVRELQNYIERVLAMNPGDVLVPIPLPRDLEDRPGQLRLGRGGRLTQTVGELERRMVEEALNNSGGNQSRAARELGMPEQSLRYRMRKYGITSARYNRRFRSKLR